MEVAEAENVVVVIVVVAAVVVVVVVTVAAAQVAEAFPSVQVSGTPKWSFE